MHRRPDTAIERFRTRAAVLVALAALGGLSTGCFEAGQESQRRMRADTDLSNISRPFSFGRTNGAAAARVEVVAAEDLSARFAAGERSWSAAMNDAEGLPPAFAFSRENPVAESYRFAGSGPEIRSVQGYGNSRGQVAAHSAPSLMSSAAVYLDRSFNSLFASIFKKVKEDSLASISPGNSREESGNPFTDARQKADAAANSAARTAPTPEDASPAKTSDSSETAAASPPVPTAVAGPPPAPEPVYVFLGDFDGSGRMQASQADRLDDVNFSFQDSRMEFSLYVNPAAVDSQRSFGVEDIDGDGIADLLVTARSSLAGGILLGSADGSFTLRDTFLTGYEPVVATAGLVRDGRRELVTVNIRSGRVTTFRASPRYRQVRAQALLDFPPDFANHIVELQTGGDYLMAAKAGRGARIFQWREDSRLDASGENLPIAPSLSLSKDFLADGATETVQAYQVGSYASITLTNSHGQTFNVANIRMRPELFIAIGDLSKRGTLDVAVAYLRSTQPK